MNWKQKALVGLGIVGGIAMVTGWEERHAEEQLRAEAVKLKIPYEGAACVGGDTDKDGYVSCTLTQRGAGTAMITIPFECSTIFSLNTGCRPPKFNSGYFMGPH